MRVKVGVIRKLKVFRGLFAPNKLGAEAKTAPALFLIPDMGKLTPERIAYIEGYEQGAQDALDYLRERGQWQSNGSPESREARTKATRGSI